MFSKGTGIVCEYNPFHLGHAYQIQKAKQMGAQFIVCAMSGDFVQRGEPAFQDKYVRAKNAVLCGADIVLEIPFPYSSMSAEGFCRSGISILESSGLCSGFVFGSECDDVNKLHAVANMLTKDFHKDVLSLQKETPNLSYAAARQELIQNRLGKEYSDIIKNPNDILGVEYLKANKSLYPITVKRTTPRQSYDQNFASSSYIRNTYFNDGSFLNVMKNMPGIYDFSGIYSASELFEKHMLLSLMTKKPKELSNILEVAKGSEHAIVKAAKEARSFKELCKNLSSKTFTDAKISRMLLFSFFGISKKYANQVPAYSTILASSDLGKKMLKKYRSDRKIILASRAGDVKKDAVAKTQYDLSRLCSEVFYKCETMTR